MGTGDDSVIIPLRPRDPPGRERRGRPPGRFHLVALPEHCPGARPTEGLLFEPTTELLHGVMLVIGSDDRTRWSPALAAPVRGVGMSRATSLVAGPVRTSFEQATRVAPSARVLLSDPETGSRLWCASESGSRRGIQRTGSETRRGGRR